MIVAGFGFRSTATVTSLRNALQNAGASRPDVIATADDKCNGAFSQLSNDLRIAICGIPKELLVAQSTITKSIASQCARGTGSVAEAAALAAAGPGARLLAPRALSDDKLATCAVAVSEGL